MPTEIHGFCDEQFSPLKDAFRANFDAGLELGSSLAVTHQGKLVVDLWAGWRDVGKTQPWQNDTIVRVTSTTKIMTIISLLMLVDRGLVELDEPVARYWPEFAQGGKDKVTVRDAITHQGGVPGFDPPVPFEAAHDWAGITARLAAEPHWFEGRKVLCYHNNTYGFLLGEIIRRVDGRMASQFFREEIAEKIGADFQIVLRSKADFHRLAELKQPDTPPKFPDSKLVVRVLTSIGPGDTMSWERLSAESPGGGGCGNGRSIAQVCAIMAMDGELNGKRFLSGKIVEEAATEQVFAEEPAFGWLRMGLGFGLHSILFPAPTPTAFHWGGYGGSWAMMDPKSRLSLGYAPNNWIVDLESLDPRLQRFSDALAKVAPGLN